MTPWLSTRRGLNALGAALLLMLAGAGAMAQEGDEERAWAALQDGRGVAVMRHALAPGTGDPADFRLDDCSTQRNLSDAGREQARAIGRRFRERGIEAVSVHSSQWCRCLETAELLDLGEVQPLPALNSFFRDRSTADQQTDAVRAFIREQPEPPGARVLVTHQVNVTALTGVFPRSGEVVVVTPDGSNAGVRVVGTLSPPEA